MMNVLGFAEEFSRLILRYTKTPSTNDDQSESVKPMTREEIASTIDTVLSALRMKSTNTGNILDNSSADSSVNTTVINTLAASNSTPIKQDDCARRFSLNVEPTSNFDIFVSRSSLGADGTETRTPLNNLRNADKSISQSNPIIRINSTGRSDTFVREEGQDVIMTNNMDDVFENVSTVETNDLLNDSFLVSFNEMRTFVMEIANKLDKTLEKYLRSTKQKHWQLLKSSSDLTNRSTTARTKTNLPMAMHKSINMYSGASTTSKLRAAGKENISDRRKSITSIGKNEKLNRSARVGHSMSNLNLSAANSTSGPVRNPRYAHVQSTIPKLSNRTSNKKT